MAFFTRLLVSFVVFAGLAGAASVPLVVDGTLDPAARHGLAKLRAAVSARGDSLDPADSARGRVVIVGVASPGSRLAQLAAAGRFTLPDSAEALATKRFSEGGVHYLAFAGADAMGLQYALFEAAEELEYMADDADWFQSIKEITADRQSSRYILRSQNAVNTLRISSLQL